MITLQRLAKYVMADPFRPFLIRMTNGETLEITHPDMIAVGLRTARIDYYMSDDPEEEDRGVQAVSLLLMESVEPVGVVAAQVNPAWVPPTKRGVASDLSRASGATRMVTAQTVQGYVKAEPFRPFRLHMASGRTFDVRHPEMIKVLKTYLLIFKAGDGDELPDEAESVSLMLTESISHLEAPVH